MIDPATGQRNYHILAERSLAEERHQVLKHSDLFAVFGRDGSIARFGFENQGLFFQGTRFLSRLVLTVQDIHPLLLSSTLREGNDLLIFHLTNPDFTTATGQAIDHGLVFFQRAIFLYEQRCYERITVANYGLEPVTLRFAYEFAADYADIFEVRGETRQRRGALQKPLLSDGEVLLSYHGLDDIVRQTRLQFQPNPARLEPNQATYSVKLAPRETEQFYLTVSCELEQAPPPETYEQAHEKLQHQRATLLTNPTYIHTTNRPFENWLTRSTTDLLMMLTETGHGLYPYAGIPWFSTVFGRDGIITALETLWLYPEIARGVLRYLAVTQATETDESRDAEPGKIMHEQRQGEMANLREIPFGRYYGTVDATPLFIVLAGRFYQRTADRETIEQLWPALLRALEWIENIGDTDGDSFVEYQRKTDKGISQQGWKDSEDSVFDASGKIAEAPIALAEVQGYVHEAKRHLAALARLRNEQTLANRLENDCECLRARFEQAFWCEEISCYALALDGEKRPCAVRSSNAGQLLFSSMPSTERARKVTNLMMSDAFFSGWGIRTLANSEIRYNPMSYHNGCIWPHDNALIAQGMARYGFKDATVKVLNAMFDLSTAVDSFRLPELFCGFTRRPGEGPIAYPVACSPQAWASGAVFMLLEACLGLHIDAPNNRIRFETPVLPNYLRELHINDLHVGTATVDITLHRLKQDVGIDVTRRDGDIEITITK